MLDVSTLKLAVCRGHSKLKVLLGEHLAVIYIDVCKTLFLRLLAKVLLSAHCMLLHHYRIISCQSHVADLARLVGSDLGLLLLRVWTYDRWVIFLVMHVSTHDVLNSRHSPILCPSSIVEIKGQVYWVILDSCKVIHTGKHLVCGALSVIAKLCHTFYSAIKIGILHLTCHQRLIVTLKAALIVICDGWKERALFATHITPMSLLLSILMPRWLSVLIELALCLAAALLILSNRVLVVDCTDKLTAGSWGY